MVDIYYAIQGPEQFEETHECEWWINSSHWAKDVILAYAVKQDFAKPGTLFRVIYRPKVAPNFKYLRLPRDWVIEIPCFKYIAYAQDEQWMLEKSKDGNIMVVRR